MLDTLFSHVVSPSKHMSHHCLTMNVQIKHSANVSVLIALIDSGAAGKSCYGSATHATSPAPSMHQGH